MLRGVELFDEFAQQSWDPLQLWRVGGFWKICDPKCRETALPILGGLRSDPEFDFAHACGLGEVCGGAGVASDP
jgi:hypothetical protein